MSPPSELREQQLAAVLEALTRQPGLTAYRAGAHVPVALAAVEHGTVNVLTHDVPLTLTLSLLHELEKTGRARRVDDPHGNRWYSAASTPSCGPLSQCARTGHVDRLPGQGLADHIGAVEDGPA